MTEPTVVKGPRGADSRGQFRKEMGLPTEIFPNVPEAKEGEAVFISPHSTNYRIVLWERWDRAFLDRNGRRVPDRKEVVFLGGSYRTTNEEEIEALRKSTSYGIYYFEKSVLEAAARSAKLNAALSAAEDPEVAAALKVKLGVQEMPLPVRKDEDSESAPETRVKPIR